MEGTAHARGWLVEGAKSSLVFMVTGDKGEVGAEEVDGKAGGFMA